MRSSNIPLFSRSRLRSTSPPPRRPHARALCQAGLLPGKRDLTVNTQLRHALFALNFVVAEDVREVLVQVKSSSWRLRHEWRAASSVPPPLLSSLPPS
eukprot:6207192-Pleurochrysis_carterae.AAC.1